MDCDAIMISLRDQKEEGWCLISLDGQMKEKKKNGLIVNIMVMRKKNWYEATGHDHKNQHPLSSYDDDPSSGQDRLQI